MSLFIVFLSLELLLRVGQYWVLNYYKLDRVFTSPDSFNILFLGDSFVAGGGTESGLGFPGYMEKGLEGKRVNGKQKLDIVNIGLSGTDTFIHKKRLDLYLRGNTIKPDLVFVVTGVNNFTTNNIRSAYIDDPVRNAPVTIWNRIIYRNMLLTFIEGVVVKDNYFPFKQCEADFNTVQFRDYVVQRFRQTLKEMIETIGAEGVHICFGTYIRMQELDHLNLVALTDIADEYDIPLMNIYSEDRDRRFMSMELYTKDLWHPNDKGHKDLADTFITMMKEEALLSIQSEGRDLDRSAVVERDP